MKEKDQRYYDNLDEIKAYFPGRNLLTKQDVVRYTGQCYRTVCRTYPFRGNYISVASFARCLS